MKCQICLLGVIRESGSFTLKFKQSRRHCVPCVPVEFQLILTSENQLHLVESWDDRRVATNGIKRIDTTTLRQRTPPSRNITLSLYIQSTMPGFTPKPALAKLSLVARKDSE